MLPMLFRPICVLWCKLRLVKASYFKYLEYVYNNVLRTKFFLFDLVFELVLKMYYYYYLKVCVQMTMLLKRQIHKNNKKMLYYFL